MRRWLVRSLAIVATATSSLAADEAVPRSLDDQARGATLVVGHVAAEQHAPVLAVVNVPQLAAPSVVSRPALDVTTTCAPHWSHAQVDIDRCIAGDADGCVGIGDEYKNGCDAYSSIKWYRRGCRLGSNGACAALTTMGESVPPPPL